jgi:hypothetical protein
MTETSAIKVGRGFVLAGILVFLSGCGPRATSRDQTAGEQGILKIGRAYVSFAAAAKDGLGPATADELKKWLTADEKRLTDLGLSRADVDGIFISPRDGQPYEIQPKRQPNPFVPGGAPTGRPGKAAPKAPGYGQAGILVNEKTGEGGKRFVFMSGSRMQEVDEAEFGRLLRSE